MRRVDVTQNNVAARLVIYLVADLLKDPDRLLTRNAWQPARASTSMTSSDMGGGIGSPCFLRLAR